MAHTQHYYIHIYNCMFFIDASLMKLFVAFSQLLNLPTPVPGLGVPITASRHLNTDLISPWVNGILDKRSSKFLGSIFDGTDHEKQTNSTKTNPEKAGARTEKGNEGQGGTSHKTSLSSLQ